MITLFNIGDEVEIRFKGKIDGIMIRPNESGDSEIRYGVVYTQPDGYTNHISFSENKLLKLAGVEEETKNEPKT